MSVTKGAAYQPFCLEIIVCCLRTGRSSSGDFNSSLQQSVYHMTHHSPEDVRPSQRPFHTSDPLTNFHVSHMVAVCAHYH